MADFYPSATVVADSISEHGFRLTSTVVTLHRWILPELNTHRTFSKSSGSSRAIPVAKTLQRIADERVLPLIWATEQRGMQGGQPLGAVQEMQAEDIWLKARDAAVQAAEELFQLGVHKSITNRLLEPFMSHTVIVTGVEWENFYQQRCSNLAQPEMEAAARVMRAAQRASTPTELKQGDWHLPFIQDDERDLPIRPLVKMSAARCARTSYLNHFGLRSLDDDLNLYRRLREADPPHWSPMEHVATPDIFCGIGNLPGYRQLRHHEALCQA